MKKLFKSLAIVLALTLVIGTVPVAAETTPSLAKSELSLFVDGTKAVKNLLNGYDSTTMALTSSSKDNSVATVTSNNIKAVAPGKTTIAIIVKNAKGTTVLNTSVALTVKNHATVDTLKIAFNGGYDNLTFSAGSTVQVSTPMFAEDGTTQLDYDSDREISCVGPDGKKVTCTADPTAKRVWSVTFATAGTYKITAKANGGAVTKTVDVKVVSGVAMPSSIKQVAYNAFEITYIGGEAKLAVADFKADSVYWELRGAVVPFSAVKSVECDGATATVTMYTGFTPNREYKAKVGDSVLAFTAVQNNYKAVDRIEVVTVTAEVEKETDIVAKMYNGTVDITDTAKTGDVVWDLTVIGGDDSAVDTSNFKVTFGEIGKEVQVQAILSYYDSEVEDDVTKTSEVSTIAAIPAEVIVVTETKYAIEATADVTKDNLGTKTWFAIGDEAFLCGRLTYSDKDKTKKSFAEITDGSSSSAYAYSCNENICMVISDIDDQGFKLAGVETGTTAIIVAHVDENDEEVVDMVCPVTVKAARVATKISECASDRTYLNTANDVADVATITIKILDQYNEPFVGAPATIEQTAATKDTAKGFPEVDAINPVGGQNAGYYAWTIEAGDINDASLSGEKNVKFDIAVTDTNLKKTVSIKMRKYTAADTTPDGYAFQTTRSTVDTALLAKAANNANNYSSDITVIAKKGAYSLGAKCFNLVKEMPKKTLSYGQYDATSNNLITIDGDTIGDGETVTAGGLALCVTVFYNGTKNLVSEAIHDVDSEIIATNDGWNAASSFADFITINPANDKLTVSGVNSNMRLAAGTYTFTLCAATLDAVNTSYLGNKANYASCKITVNDAQAKVTPKLTKNTSSDVGVCTLGTNNWNDDGAALVRDCWELKFTSDSATNYGVEVHQVKYIKNNSSNKTSVFVYQAHITMSGWYGSVPGTTEAVVTLNKLISNAD